MPHGACQPGRPALHPALCAGHPPRTARAQSSSRPAHRSRWPLPSAGSKREQRRGQGQQRKLGSNMSGRCRHGGRREAAGGGSRAARQRQQGRQEVPPASTAAHLGGLRPALKVHIRGEPAQRVEAAAVASFEGAHEQALRCDAAASQPAGYHAQRGAPSRQPKCEPPLSGRPQSLTSQCRRWQAAQRWRARRRGRHGGPAIGAGQGRVSSCGRSSSKG